MLRITIRARAAADVQEHARWIERDSIRTARKFQDAAARTFSHLAVWPESGAPFELDSYANMRLRRWHISGFATYRVFYRIEDESIEIVRVLYGSQDIHDALK